jgi:hypothetical protein
MNQYERDEIAEHARKRRGFERQVMRDYLVFRGVLRVLWGAILALLVVTAVLGFFLLRSVR